MHSSKADDFRVEWKAGAFCMRSELTAAFNTVANPTNWKLPVDAAVTGQYTEEFLGEAVTFFTGSFATFYSAGSERRVKADGYYAVCGA